MKVRGRSRIVGGALGALLLVGTFGCTGSDDLTSESGSVSVDVVMSPPGADRFDAGVLTLVQISIRPTDPVADQTLGVTSIGMIPVPVQLAFTDPSVVHTQTRPLSAGQWRLDAVTFRYPSNPPMRDFDPIDPSTSCLDAVLFRTGGTLPPPELIPNPFKDSFVFKVGPLSPPFVFTLDRSGAKRIRMLIDGPGLARLFQSSFTCRSSGTCPSGNSSINAPCMSGFTEFTTAQLLPLITFE